MTLRIAALVLGPEPDIDVPDFVEWNETPDRFNAAVNSEVA